jgi:hypothetical protein
MSTKLQAPGGDFFFHHGGKNPPCFELGQLGQDARLGSGGEGNLSIDDVAADDGAQLDDLLIWFRAHKSVR